MAMHTVRHGDVDLAVEVRGTGPALLLVHGWPHTGLIWRDVAARLEDRYRVIVPDLRGVGGSQRAASGYDLETLAADVAAVLDGVNATDVLAVGIDVGASVTWMLGARHPGRVRRLVLMEGLLGGLPGAEEFLANPPWWFGFHAVDGFAETVVEGREDRYVGWFLDRGTAGGRMEVGLREKLVAAYTGADALRCGFEFYRNGAVNDAQIAAALADPRRPDLPTLAVAGGVVGSALCGQLSPITTDLSTHDATHCGHLIPVDDPAGLAAAIVGFDELADER